MKKLFLLTAVSSIALGASAQFASQSVVFNPSSAHKIGTYTSNLKARTTLATPAAKEAQARTANKGAAAMDRWYDYYGTIDQFNNGSLSGASNWFPTWGDSTILQGFVDGLHTVNYSSIGAVINPEAPKLNDQGLYEGAMSISYNDSYRLDSVYFYGAYIKVPTRPSSIVDTLIISVGPVHGSWYVTTSTPNVNAAAYLPTGKDTLFCPGFVTSDSVARTMLPDVSAAVAPTVWKVPLTDTDRNAIDYTVTPNTLTPQNFTYAVPGGGIDIAAGYNVGVSFTFKSGDSWNPNVDSLDMYHHMLWRSGEAGGQATQMPYDYYNGDFNMSQMLFSTFPSQYQPSLLVEAENTTNFGFEYHMIQAHMTCNTCSPVSVKNVTPIATIGSAYPNPANDIVTVPFTVSKTADVNISISNTLGQVVKTQNVGTVPATRQQNVSFTTSDLAPGVYFYTVEANGQRTTNRVAVAH